MLNNRGQMRVVEAFLSILLLFSALALTTLISPASNFNNNNDDLAAVGMQALVSMDHDGKLGKLVDETVYDENLQPLNNVSISNGIIPDQNIVSIQYPCASPTPQGNCYLLRLQLATAR